MNLVKRTKVTRAMNAVAAGTTDQTSTWIDMANFDGIMFLINFGTITSGAVTSVKLQGATDSSGTGATDLTGTAITVADTDDNKIAILDLYQPDRTYRYIAAYVDRGTQNAVIDGIQAIQYAPRNVPTTHDSTTVLGSEAHASEAAGTA